MKHKQQVTKKGQKFIFYGKVFTVKSFFGKSGYEFTTAKAAYYANDKQGKIYVKNVEFGGATRRKESIVFTYKNRKK